MDIMQTAILIIALGGIFLWCELLKRNENKEVMDIIHKLNKVRRLTTGLDTIFNIDTRNCSRLLGVAREVREILIELDNKTSNFLVDREVIDHLITRRLSIVNRLIELLETLEYYNKTNNNIFIKGTSTLAVK